MRPASVKLWARCPTLTAAMKERRALMTDDPSMSFTVHWNEETELYEVWG